MSIGWIKLHRSLISWEWYDDENCLRLLIHLLITVNYIDKNWRGEHIRAGSRVTSWEKLAGELNLSVRQIRTAMSKLEKSGEVTRKASTKWQTVTLCKWDSLQDERQANDKQGGRQETDKRQTNDRQTTTTKESKKEKNIKNDKNEEISLFQKETKFNFKDSLLNSGFDKELVEDWLKVRKTKKASNTKTAFNGFLKEIQSVNNLERNEILKICVEKSWSGFRKDWLDNLNNSNNGTTGQPQDATERNKRDSENSTRRLAEKLFGELQDDSDE